MTISIKTGKLFICKRADTRTHARTHTHMRNFVILYSIKMLLGSLVNLCNFIVQKVLLSNLSVNMYYFKIINVSLSPFLTLILGNSKENLNRSSKELDLTSYRVVHKSFL